MDEFLVTGRSGLNRNQAKYFIFIIVALRLSSKVTEINSAYTFKVCFHNQSCSEHLEILFWTLYKAFPWPTAAKADRSRDYLEYFKTIENSTELSLKETQLPGHT